MPIIRVCQSRPLIFLLLLIHSSASLYAFDASDSIDQDLKARGFIKGDIRGKFFSLRSWSKISNPLKPVNVYIEGDGRNYITPRHISKNPTPRSSLVRNLCLVDPADNVVYLARPCQFTDPSSNPGWGPEYWTHKRFAPEVITEINEAVSSLKESYELQDFYLYGYSGGATIAALIAAKRSDIAGFVSIAGNLDHNAVNDFHNAARMPESLNAMDLAQKLSDIPQVYLLGEKDRVIPPTVVKNFIQKLDSSAKVQIIPVLGATHTTGWLSRWQELLRDIDSHFASTLHAEDNPLDP